MKLRLIKFVGVIALCLISLTLTGCGATQKYADKINEKASAGSHLTYEDVIQKLGNPTIKISTASSIIGETGICFWVNGCKNIEEVNQRFEDKKEVKGISITFLNGKAMSATYAAFTSEDFENK